jgi:hypothetical protein
LGHIVKNKLCHGAAANVPQADEQNLGHGIILSLGIVEHGQGGIATRLLFPLLRLNGSNTLEEKFAQVKRALAQQGSAQ